MFRNSHSAPFWPVTGTTKCDSSQFVLIIIALAFISGCSGGGSEEPIDLTNATYVGRQSCVQCHQEQSQLFVGSHHDLAMQDATSDSVLGDFNDAEIEHFGVVSRMYRDGDRFMVRTEGPDGQMHDYEIDYVFGVSPLQQYMVEFPTDSASSESNAVDGLPRIQVLRICWNTEKKEWFYLPAPDVDDKLAPDDDLHWTGIAQRWNTMCAECHSTNYQKDFKPGKPVLNLANNKRELPSNDPFHNRSIGSYHSKYAEIDVSCESCHGPASVHVELAKQNKTNWNRNTGFGLADLKSSPENQIQSCAPCHSRRSVLEGGFVAGDNFYDHYVNELLTEGVYYPDGQILDEDYVHGSFIQSKMYHKGIKCSDCHDPHTARLKHSGNQVCTSCHQHPAAKYDTPAHHFHEAGTPGAACVNCHMPAQTYMEIDSRRDHSFRIPRPDLSLKIDTPNACAGCHIKKENVPEELHAELNLYQDWMRLARDGNAAVKAELERANKWSDQACEKWYGESRRSEDHFGTVIAAAQRGDHNAAELLLELIKKEGYVAPAIARATAMMLLSEIDPLAAAQQAFVEIKDDHPLVRANACSALVATIGTSKTKDAVEALENGLADSVFAVRAAAARSLVIFPETLRRGGVQLKMQRVLADIAKGLEFSNDRAGAHMALATMSEQQGQGRSAIAHYEDAIAVEPGVAGPRTNLASLVEMQSAAQARTIGDQASEAEKLVTTLRKQELQLLIRDAKLLPESAGLQYRLGMAYYLDDQADKAIEPLKQAAALESDRPDFAQALAMLYEKLGKWPEAVQAAKEALRRDPTNAQSIEILQRIQASAK